MQRWQFKIFGTVQGVGFRPFVYNLATSLKLCGFVQNGGGGVVVEVEGSYKNIAEFERQLLAKLPPLAKITAMQKKEIALLHSTTFEITKSAKEQKSSHIPTDVALCNECLEDMHNSSNRRYNYPFINCTNCGVRYTIVQKMPYDRANTSMEEFEMCSECAKEYNNPQSRFYHAQPISCSKCGPELYLLEDGKKKDVLALEFIAKQIEQGEIVAIKGVGGFHLVCDATSSKVVQKLRNQKNRPTKPLAVMFSSIEALQKDLFVSKKEFSLVQSIQSPIVLLKQKQNSTLAKNIAPKQKKIGAFLPHTPLQHLLFEKLSCAIVATSANISGEPIIADEQELFVKLGHIVKYALSYNREIVRKVDDSVIALCNEREVIYRLGRGYAPLPLTLAKTTQKKILAVGANQKSSIALAFGNEVVLSPYIGDLETIQSIEHFEKTLEAFMEFYNFKPDIIVHDMHPNYESSKWAKTQSGIELVEVQHHYAHALSVMAEYGLENDVIAFCFDGTGLGDDGTLWGGEVLVCSPHSYTRVGHFEPFSLLGGERAIKEIYRIALALLLKVYTKEELANHPLFREQKGLQTLCMMHEKNLNVIQSSSVGRVYDGVFALMSLQESVSYEGEAGMSLEQYVDESIEEFYPFSVNDGVIEYKQMLQEILKENNPVQIASKFTNTLAQIVLYFAKGYQKDVVLCGGVFQNIALQKAVVKLLEQENITYYIQQTTPLNDGSIALGQIYYGVKNYE